MATYFVYERERVRERIKSKIQSKITLLGWWGEGHDCVVSSKAVVIFLK